MKQKNEHLLFDDLIDIDFKELLTYLFRIFVKNVHQYIMLSNEYQH